MTAHQGHRYQLGIVDVLALSSGPRPRVARIDLTQPWPLGRPFHVNAEQLKLQPMRYFGGEVRS
ncbi:hypothetical protein SAMN05216344_102192 [Polaromonas sp. OV174]|uniref:hypothetical protein n=1 Tax=Polaromonas sp. OV174 TaxID=1855300 RepID=UPI0008ECA8ED|nr:hypothetical protein [Polaromonas sp. OV174]SFB74432.1 hypothetical protein SAMN05216344_102192 [Polaromonas sp. OV174]